LTGRRRRGSSYPRWLRWQLQGLQDEYEELDRRTEQLKSVDIASRDFEELIRLIDRQLAILRAAAVLVGDLPT
jgi:hypothetical protein